MLVDSFGSVTNLFLCNCSRFFMVGKFLTVQEIDKYKLNHPKSFHYLNQSKCYELVGINDAHDYLATRRAMDIVGISKIEQVYPI